jgi:hypothetical protein
LPVGKRSVETRPAGLEPAAFEFEVRDSENTSPEQTKTCKISKERSTPQLTPKYQKRDENQLRNVPTDLAEIVAVWPELPEHIKAAIKALVQPQLEKKTNNDELYL